MSEPSWWVIVLVVALVSGLVAWLRARAGQRAIKRATDELLARMNEDERDASTATS